MSSLPSEIRLRPSTLDSGWSMSFASFSRTWSGPISFSIPTTLSIYETWIPFVSMELRLLEHRLNLPSGSLTALSASKF